MKILLWLILIFAVIWVLRSKKKSMESVYPPPPSSNVADGEVETMLSCAHCQTYFPASEAVRDAGGQEFCSEEHRRQHATH